MKLAVKIVTIINMVANAIGLILVFALQGVVKDEAARGELIVNGEKISSQDVEAVLNVVPVLAGIVAFIIICGLVLLALNLYFLSKDNLTAILILGIVHLVFGVYLIAILDIVYYIMNKDKSDFAGKEVVEPSANEDGKYGF